MLNFKDISAEILSSTENLKQHKPLNIMMPHKKKNKQGFTLVEIMIVVVIIGLLAAMAIPAFNKVREESRKKAITNNLRQVAHAGQQYILENGTTRARWTDLVDVYFKDITPVAGESYTRLVVLEDGTTPLSVTTTGGLTVSYDY